ncbi:MAG: hypothetical protein PHV37_08185 [Candidatus Gastranaerophilales bacterium]|nr:hypothetical protein [Candidatus Gastranaerophilales bacterium]
MGYDIGANQSDIFRAIGKVSSAGKYDSDKEITPLADAADKKAANIDDKTGVTVALEDFTKLTNSFDSNGRSQVTSKNAKSNIFEKIGSIFGKKSDNVFKNSVLKDSLAEDSYTQSDILSENIAKNGGLQFKKDGDDLYNSALNYAKADIAAVEKSFANAHPEDGFQGKKLNLNTAEVSSYISDNSFLTDNFEKLDLDGKKKSVSAEEYASYMLVADKMSNGKNDGKITSDEADAFKGVKMTDLQKEALKIYNAQYKK